MPCHAANTDRANRFKSRKRPQSFAALLSFSPSPIWRSHQYEQVYQLHPRHQQYNQFIRFHQKIISNMPRIRLRCPQPPRDQSLPQSPIHGSIDMPATLVSAKKATDSRVYQPSPRIRFPRIRRSVTTTTLPFRIHTTVAPRRERPNVPALPRLKSSPSKPMQSSGFKIRILSTDALGRCYALNRLDPVTDTGIIYQEDSPSGAPQHSPRARRDSITMHREGEMFIW